MDSYEPTTLLLSKIKTFDPENAGKILGFLLLQDLTQKDLMRLLLGPDAIFHNLILKAKSHLGLSSNTSSAPFSPISRPNNATHPFSNADSCFDFQRNPPSPSALHWPISGFPTNNPASPKATPLLSFDNIRGGSVSVPPFSHPNNGNGANSGVARTNSGDLIDEKQLTDYLSFLNESSKHDDLVDPRVELGYGANTHLHRRSFSASDACFGSEDGSFVSGGFRPCLYFARGFCKNGSNCKFVHGALPDNFDASGPIVGSPSKFDGFEQRDELMRLKALEQQRLAAMSQFGPRAMSPYNKYTNLLLQQQNDSQRSAAAALMMEEELHRFGRLRAERNDFMVMGLADKSNSASRQIYLTFPADSSFKDEDVSEYFGHFGPVQDVRIPYQQKRMFGFVTFVFPETVKVILAKGNPHFICDSRVLVKPYKEKGKVPDRRQQFQHQQSERGDFSGCFSPSELDDLHLGARTFYSAQEMMLRRKLEQEAIELQGRRLINLHLPDFKDENRHHQRSFSVGAAASLPMQSHNYVNQEVAEDNKDYPASTAADQLQLKQEVDAASVLNSDGGNGKESSIPGEKDDCQSVEHLLSDSLFDSPTKSAGNFSFISSALTEVEDNNAISTATSENNILLATSSASDMASH